MYSFLSIGVDHATPGTSVYIFKMLELATFITPLSICQVLSQFVFLSTVFTSSLSIECIFYGFFVCVPNIFLYNCIKAFCSM